MYSSLILKHSCLFHVKHNKNLLLLASYFSILFQKEHLYFGPPHNSVCDVCNHARKINSFPRKGQLNKSGNFSI